MASANDDDAAAAPITAPADDNNIETFTTKCHCGRLQAHFQCSARRVVVHHCNCSDCFMRQNWHVIVPRDRFHVAMPHEALEDATILYQWGTQQAIRRFCATCGILPWYIARSNPDGVAITANCVDWTKCGTVRPPALDIAHFDGRNWEASMAARKEQMAAFSASTSSNHH